MAKITTSDCTMAFAIPGEDSIVDVINPVTEKSWFENEDLEAIRLRYPKAEIVNLEDWCKAKAARQDTPVTWDQITKEHYWEWLECLPPAIMVGGAFMVGEPRDHHATSGLPRYQACNHEKGKYWASSRAMTIPEFKRWLRGE